MIRSSGDNHFPENKFDFWTWSAPVLETPEEVVAKVRELKLIGRTIKDICVIGYNYNFDGDPYYDIFKAIQQKDEKALATLEFPCLIRIDEPLLIRFEDGDVLGIDFSEGSSVRMDLNTLPWDIGSTINGKNFSAGRMFKEVLGRKIIDASITASLNEPTFTGSHGLSLEEQETYVRSLAFVCAANGHDVKRPFYVNLVFEALYDYGTVSLEKGVKLLYLPGTDLKGVMEGYLTPAVLQHYL
ncbi:MAG: hypothetical protein IJS14_15360 [Lentisphaeria bacterium]|nr:hypothetical protein [Lentisphaeria bacterium]